MPTSLPPRRKPKEHDPRGVQNLAAIAVSLALLLLCIWLYRALSDSNSKLNCVWQGRTNCDEQYYR